MQKSVEVSSKRWPVLLRSSKESRVSGSGRGAGGEGRLGESGGTFSRVKNKTSQQTFCFVFFLAICRYCQTRWAWGWGSGSAGALQGLAWRVIVLRSPTPPGTWASLGRSFRKPEGFWMGSLRGLAGDCSALSWRQCQVRCRCRRRGGSVWTPPRSASGDHRPLRL